MLFTGVPAALLLITSNTIAAPISTTSTDTSTKFIKAVGALETSSELAINIVADISGAEAAVKTSAVIVPNIIMNAVFAQSSDFTKDPEAEDRIITKRWGKNSFKDCTDKYDCAVECGMGTDQCWKTCKGDPLYPDCDTYRVQRIDNWKKQHDDREGKD